MTDQSAQYPSLRDRNVLITGGATGIGASAVRQFAKQGARVAFLDVQDEMAKQLVSELSDAVRISPVYSRCNLIDIAALQKIITELQADMGSFHVLVNNAANDDRHNFEGTSRRNIGTMSEWRSTCGTIFSPCNPLFLR